MVALEEFLTCWTLTMFELKIDITDTETRQNYLAS